MGLPPRRWSKRKALLSVRTFLSANHHSLWNFPARVLVSSLINGWSDFRQLANVMTIMA